MAGHSWLLALISHIRTQAKALSPIWLTWTIIPVFINFFNLVSQKWLGEKHVRQVESVCVIRYMEDTCIMKF